MYLAIILFCSQARALDVTQYQQQLKEFESLDRELQEVKHEVLEINSDLRLLEEKLLYPANTQINVFVSMDKDVNFKISSVTLTVDDKIVSQHLYTDEEINALKRGAVHRLYTGNLALGIHQLFARFVGYGEDSERVQEQLLKITKEPESKFVELRIEGAQAGLEGEARFGELPELKVFEW